MCDFPQLLGPSQVKGALKPLQHPGKQRTLLLHVQTHENQELNTRIIGVEYVPRTPQCRVLHRGPYVLDREVGYPTLQRATQETPHARWGSGPRVLSRLRARLYGFCSPCSVVQTPSWDHLSDTVASRLWAVFRSCHQALGETCSQPCQLQWSAQGTAGALLITLPPSSTPPHGGAPQPLCPAGTLGCFVGFITMALPYSLFLCTIPHIPEGTLLCLLPAAQGGFPCPGPVRM